MDKFTRLKELIEEKIDNFSPKRKTLLILLELMDKVEKEAEKEHDDEIFNTKIFPEDE